MPRRVPSRALKEALHWTTVGSRPRSANSSTSKVLANQPRSSASSSSSMTQAPTSGVSMKRIIPSRSSIARRAPCSAEASRQQLQLGSACGEPAAPLADVAQLLHDLILEVPWQDQHYVRPVLADCLRRADRQVAAGQEVPLLVRVEITRVIDQVPAHTAVVEHRVALGRCSVADHLQSLLLEIDQEAEDLPLVGLDALAVAEIRVELLEARRTLSLAQRSRGV